MKIQYCSDLHLEFDQNSKYIINKPLKVSGEILVLAGDTVPLHDEYYKDPFFSFISRNYKEVYWVPGNHEFYHKDLSEFSRSFNIKLRNNIHIVNNIDLQYGGVRFIFSTLWSRISSENEENIVKSVSDFDCISKQDRKLRASDFNALHKESLEFIQQSLKEKKGKTVVVTHHLPSGLCNSPDHKNSPINEAFSVELTDLVESSDANFWIYGHSHFNQKPLYVGNTLMLTNQLGYVHCNEHTGFKNNAYFAI